MNKVMDLKCPGCAKRIKHNPVNNNFECKYCENIYTIKDLKQNDNSYEEADILNYKCNNCGAEISVADKEVSTECIYCGNTAIIVGRLSNKYRPDYIVPFKTNKNDINKQLKWMAKNNIEIDHSFLKEMVLKKVTPIYIPYFIYSFNLSANVNVAYMTEGSGQSICFNESKKVRIELDNVPIDGSKALDDNIMMNLFPYNLDEMLEYEHAYLSGHLCEMYDEPREDARKKIIELSKNSIRNFYFKKITNPYSVTFITTNINQESVKYILLPVWIIELTHDGKNIKFYMNGQTKEMIGYSNYIKNSTLLFSIIWVIACILLGGLFKKSFLFFILLALLPIYSYLKKDNKSETVKKCTSLEMFKDSSIIKEELYK